MKVGDVMTCAVWAVPPEMRLKEVATLLVQRKVSGVPVVDDERRVLGVVSESDLIRIESDARPTVSTLHTAGDAMTAPAVTIERGERIGRAAALMLEAGVKRLPVIRNGKLEGIVTRGDLLRAFVRRDELLAREVSADLIEREPPVAGAADVGVVVDDGIVVLSGRVTTAADAEALADAARRVAGVVDVRSDLVW